MARVAQPQKIVLATPGGGQGKLPSAGTASLPAALRSRPRSPDRAAGFLLARLPALCSRVSSANGITATARFPPRSIPEPRAFSGGPTVSRVILTATILAFLLFGVTTKASAEATPQCGNANEVQSTTPTRATFYPVKVGQQGSFRRRDFEFLWDTMYDAPGAIGLSEADLATLNGLGIRCADSHHNVFGANLTDVQLVHEYFRADTTAHYVDDDPLAPGLVVGSLLSNPDCEPRPCPPPGAMPYSERRHVDIYLVHPDHDNRGRTPSAFVTAKEDSFTGWWAANQNWTSWTQNSIQFLGPPNASRV